MKRKITIRDRATGDAGPDSGQDGSVDQRFEIDPIGLLRLLLRRRRWIIGVVGLASILAVATLLRTPNRYTSRASILPSGKSNNLSALRAMAGLAGGLSLEDDNSSALFPLILQSDLVRDSLLARRYQFSFESESFDLSLAEYLVTDDPDRLRRGLGDITAISSSTRTGGITIAVETEYPEFSQALVQEYLNRLEDFNLHSRRSEAKERVRYLARELDERSRALKSAEDSLEAFQSRHRNWAATTNPVVLKQLARLKQQVEAKGKTYVYLLQEYEVSKLDAQKDVPIVRILDRASLPTLKSGPYRSRSVILVAVVSFALVVLAIFLIDLVQDAARHADNGSREALVGDIKDAFPRTARLQEEFRRRVGRETISVDS